MSHDWVVYDSCAEELARKGLTGEVGDPLPINLSEAVFRLINEDVEAFQLRVRQSAYALAMAKVGA